MDLLICMKRGLVSFVDFAVIEEVYAWNINYTSDLHYNCHCSLSLISNTMIFQCDDNE